MIFVGVTERFDEPFTCMVLLWGLEDREALTTDATGFPKHTRHRQDIPDDLLYDVAVRSLDQTIASLGRLLVV
jgi:hypothetical protein